MTEDPTPEEICRPLERSRIRPAASCGSAMSMTIASETGTLPPLDAARSLSSALYFLVTLSAPVRLHRIRSAQLYHHYLGDALEVLQLHADGSTERSVVGADLRAGERPQLLIPGDTFHTARLRDGGRWFLGASTSGRAEPADVEPGDLEALCASHADVADELRAIAAA